MSLLLPQTGSRDSCAKLNRMIWSWALYRFIRFCTAHPSAPIRIPRNHMNHSFLQNKVSKERVQCSGSDRITARLSTKRRRTVEKKLTFELSASAFIPSGDKKFILRDHGAPRCRGDPLTPLSTALSDTQTCSKGRIYAPHSGEADKILITILVNCEFYVTLHPYHMSLQLDWEKYCNFYLFLFWRNN